MGGVYREELTSSRLHASRFFYVAQEDEDPEIVREKARRVRALGLEPPRYAHFRQFARRQGLIDEVEQAQTDVVVPRQSSPSGSGRPDLNGNEKNETSEDGSVRAKALGESEGKMIIQLQRLALKVLPHREKPSLRGV
eukprot:Skav211422  [mRNA]  locus=scaffold1608:255138:265585:+ [translate_table: standard]